MHRLSRCTWYLNFHSLPCTRDHCGGYLNIHVAFASLILHRRISVCLWGHAMIYDRDYCLLFAKLSLRWPEEGNRQ